MIIESELIQLSIDKVVQTKAYTIAILGNNEKRFGIYLDPQVGKVMQLYLTNTERQRPYTHDLMESCFQGFGIEVQQVVIMSIQDTIYYARLFLEQKIGDFRHIVEVDCRPSDSLTLALIKDVPIFCTKEVFEESIAVED
ncbi:DUF151 domain-containing protein [Chlamydiales bacterium]|nr:DUF151 domain-containing protein [Chlamydiales bacterium]